MALFVHIFIALTSVVFATYLLARPTDSGFKISYGLVVLTIISGTYLAWSEPVHLLQACVSGLVYISLVLCALVAARRKLARIKI